MRSQGNLIQLQKLPLNNKIQRAVAGLCKYGGIIYNESEKNYDILKYLDGLAEYNSNERKVVCRGETLQGNDGNFFYWSVHGCMPYISNKLQNPVIFPLATWTKEDLDEIRIIMCEQEY